MKIAMLFIGVVSVVLIVSLTVKLVLTAEQSIFDGQNQFVLLLRSVKNNATLIDVDPGFSSLYVLYILNSKHDNIQTDIPVGIDGTIRTDNPISSVQDIRQVLLQSAFPSQFRGSGLIWLDALRLYGIMRTISGSKTLEQKITLPISGALLTQVESHFVDPELQSENVPIQIINASDLSGKGTHLETLLTNTGCSVIDVRTNQTVISRSVINYYGTISYTVKKLSRILGFSVHRTNVQMIGNIQIIIGTDGNRQASF